MTANGKIIKSWHHRMARLVLDSYKPKCEARSCDAAADFVCEYDYMRHRKPVSGSKLLCSFHSKNYAELHRIDVKSAPAIKFSQLEFADRDNWAYGEDT